MTTYQEKPARKRKVWPLVAAVLIVGICGLCALGGVFSVIKSDDLMPSGVGSEPSVATSGTVTDGDLAFTIEKVDCSSSSVGSDAMLRRAQGVFCVVTLGVSNVGTSAQVFVSSAQKSMDAQGREYSTDDAAALLVTPDAWLSQINPGSTMRGAIVFDIPIGVRLTVLELHGGVFSTGVKIKIF